MTRAFRVLFFSDLFVMQDLLGFFYLMRIYWDLLTVLRFLCILILICVFARTLEIVQDFFLNVYEPSKNSQIPINHKKESWYLL